MLFSAILRCLLEDGEFDPGVKDSEFSDLKEEVARLSNLISQMAVPKAEIIHNKSEVSAFLCQVLDFIADYAFHWHSSTKHEDYLLETLSFNVIKFYKITNLIPKSNVYENTVSKVLVIC